MGFSSKRVFTADPSFIPRIADELELQFKAEGYDVKKEQLISGGAYISITKGGVFKAIAGMKTALKITLKPVDSHIMADASVGIFGQQAIPTIISMLFFWPVLLTQTWGLIQQSKLDDHAMELIEKTLVTLTANASLSGKNNGSFCPECGAPASGNFCSSCGKKLN